MLFVGQHKTTFEFFKGSPTQVFIIPPCRNYNAEKPLKELRWSPPIPQSPWKPNILNATTFSKACPQTGDPYVWDEDCLYLNVWTPLPSDKPFPVMVFIHGGILTNHPASITYSN